MADALRNGYWFGKKQVDDKHFTNIYLFYFLAHLAEGGDSINFFLVSCIDEKFNQNYSITIPVMWFDVLCDCINTISN